MLSKYLWRSFAGRNKIVTTLLEHNENKIRLSSMFVRNHSKKNSDYDKEFNEPLKYTTSEANEWKAAYSRIGTKAEFGPWYEPHAISVSIILFMVYFFILREENDIDLWFDNNLFDTMKAVQESEKGN